MKKQLRKPENWQDFESLCKTLWGEIWNCQEIKKNGRKGQKQYGVDIYGIPENQTQYFGIQCKGKDDYLNSNLTKKEIDEEVEKAHDFKPKLKKFYFATTANKDADIEAYIRLKNEQSVNNGGFEIHLFSWEDIVDLIDENKRTNDWYVNNIEFKSKYFVTITFKNGESHLSFTTYLVRNTITYKIKNDLSDRERLRLPLLPSDDKEDKSGTLTNPQPIIYFLNGMAINKSSSVFSLLIKNEGSVPIEHFKMYINLLEPNIITDTVDKRTHFLDSLPYKYNTFKEGDSNRFIFEPSDQILVQTDSILTDEICIRPTVDDYLDIKLEYVFIAKDFNTKGYLTIRLNPITVVQDSIKPTLFQRDSELRLENYLE
jgi:hypothetical protein